VDADLIRDTRERMHVSRAVFARRLRVSTRTLENWEQGRARPNAQATVKETAAGVIKTLGRLTFSCAPRCSTLAIRAEHG